MERSGSSSRPHENIWRLSQSDRAWRMPPQSGRFDWLDADVSTNRPTVGTGQVSTSHRLPEDGVGMCHANIKRFGLPPLPSSSRHSVVSHLLVDQVCRGLGIVRPATVRERAHPDKTSCAPSGVQFLGFYFVQNASETRPNTFDLMFSVFYIPTYTVQDSTNT
ncbi:hypothetical protein ElyMa_006540300 [Elysia marginata]|uniref:Uncharacterized protein n=1 Tax=Elysia marginata TaxID=1093978 RepID=A0AAV4I783_9GAST|nr:hypothetical protein ElyMa_006540300 [Elysia marginata]